MVGSGASGDVCVERPLIVTSFVTGACKGEAGTVDPPSGAALTSRGYIPFPCGAIIYLFFLVVQRLVVTSVGSWDGTPRDAVSQDNDSSGDKAQGSGFRNNTHRSRKPIEF